MRIVICNMLIDNFQEYVRRNGLFTKQDKILLTVSDRKSVV